MKFKAPGDSPITLALLSGHTLTVTHEQTGTPVPVEFRREAIGKGCVPIGIEVEGAKKVTKTQQKRIDTIIAGIDKMLDSDGDDLFDAEGKPELKKLSEAAGFDVTVEERDQCWSVVETKLRA